jgi:hypothetical protein
VPGCERPARLALVEQSRRLDGVQRDRLVASYGALGAAYPGHGLAGDDAPDREFDHLAKRGKIDLGHDPALTVMLYSQNSQSALLIPNQLAMPSAQLSPGSGND